MKRELPLLFPAMMLASCTVGPDYRKPASISGAVPAPALLSGREASYSAIAPLPLHWWQLYDDPVLNALEERALARNTDLRVALQTLEQARASLREIQFQRTPQTSLSIDPTYGQASGDANGSTVALKPAPVYDAMESVSYDLDLFGRLRRSIEAQKADVEAEQAALDLVRVNVAASTAQDYSSACAAGLQIAVANKSIAIAQQSLNVTQRRFDVGIAGINDVVRARTLLRQTESSLPALIAQKRNALFSLAMMTGDRPEDFSQTAAACDKPPLIRTAIPIGDGATLLARRPDVRQAERQLAAAVAQIGVSTASLYPSITIGGSFGTTATSVPDIVRNRAFTWSLGPVISWNFPNVSIVRAQIAQSNASARGALAQFDGTVLTALKEAETALTTLARELDTERELKRARDDAATANANTARLYAGGIGEFLDLLDAERTQIEAENSLASATAQVSQDQIALFMALGGGWQDAPSVDETPLTDVIVSNRARVPQADPRQRTRSKR